MVALPTDLSDDEHAEALRDVERRMHDHPGYREYMVTEGLALTVNAVVVPNHVTLLTLLDAPSRNRELAVELFQNVRRPDVREAYVAGTVRALHNYVASAVTLIDHTRRVVRGRKGPLADAYEQRKLEVLKHPEVPFVKDLRQFVLHRKLPFLGHRITIENDAVAGRIDLSVAELLEADCWSATSKTFIRGHDEALPIRPVVACHGELVVNLTNWLHNELAGANASALAEVNELVVERNALLGATPLDQARTLTDAITEIRNSPEAPASAEAMMRRMRGQSVA